MFMPMESSFNTDLFCISLLPKNYHNLVMFIVLYIFVKLYFQITVKFVDDSV